MASVYFYYLSFAIVMELANRVVTLNVSNLEKMGGHTGPIVNIIFYTS
jgi:hypothetical protein